MRRGVLAVYLFGWAATLCCLFSFRATTVRAAAGLQRISPHVYAYADGRPAMAANSFGANAGIVIGNNAIAVIDTLISAKEAHRFFNDIRKVSDKPIRYVINTHSHLDHTFGNAFFARQGATLIAHAKCNDEMRGKAKDTLAQASQYGLSSEDMAGTEIAYPEISFTDRLQLNLGDVRLELIYVAPSHSPGSILVALPADKVVFAGDILFTDFHPYIVDADLGGWQHTLDFLAALDVQTIIPGHGPLSDKDDVAQMKAYLEIFDSRAQTLAAVDDQTRLQEAIDQLKRDLPARSQGAWIVDANLMGRYLPKQAAGIQK